MNKEHVTLVICDGLGLSPESNGNALHQTATPTLDYLLNNYPSVRLLAAGTEVGLDMGEPGNSEVGHLALGTGQVLPQAFQLINTSIRNDSYRQNKALLTAFERVKKTEGATLHVVGLISSGGVHGHVDHMLTVLGLAHDKKVNRVAVHAITDGRDSPPRVAQQDSQPLIEQLSHFKEGVIASIGGRFYGMDRDHNWERTDAFFWAMAGKGYVRAHSFDQAITEAYARGEGDEHVQPTVIVDENGEPLAQLNPGDVVIVTNYRPDRIRQLSTRIIGYLTNSYIVTMTDYFLSEMPPVAQGSQVVCAYPLPKPKGTLSQALASAHVSQLHIAETEKYAHITYFFNGHAENKGALEEWLLIPSAKVNSFDRAPEMSAAGITAAYLTSKIQHALQFTTINYANMDMVGHTGNFEATKQAVAFVDSELKKVVEYAEQNNEWLLITADHGNAEQMINPVTGEPDKEHTTNPVPLILVHPSLKQSFGMTKYLLSQSSAVAMLADVAPTILDILKVPRPKEMVGSSLLPQLVR